MSLKKCHKSKVFVQLILAPSFALLFGYNALPGHCHQPLSFEEEGRLAKGEVVLDGFLDGKQSAMVEGKILINSRPDRVWSVVINPWEFANKIQKHLRDVRIIKDINGKSVQECQVEVSSFLPRVKYVVESIYEPCRRIDFRRIGGAIKDFRGYWLFEPRDNGQKTLVTYAMFIDPGFFVPQWIMKCGLRHELPETLSGIRSRVTQLEVSNGLSAQRS